MRPTMNPQEHAMVAETKDRHVNTDAKSQYWANFVEFGAGIRTRWATLPPNVHFTLQALRGVYTRNEGNPRRPNYFDIRAGFWYAITR